MSALREMRELAERTPARRDRYVDLVRAVAIAAVVVGHWLALYVTHDDRGFHGGEILEAAPWTRPLTWPFQVMPLFFLVGGYANAASLTSHLGRGGDATGWVLGRSVRLVRPTTVLLCGLVVAAVTARLAGVSTVTIGLGVWLAAIPLWFLVAYLAVVVLTPLMYALHRRAGLAVPIALAALVGAGDLARLTAAVPYAGQANFLLAWLAVHQLGFAWQDGRLPARRSVALPLAFGGLVALVLLTVAGPYPVSMVGFGGERLQNTSPPTLALLALAVTQTGIALSLHEPGNRRLRRPGPWTAVVAVNSVIMTLFLWHMTALVIGVLALYGTDVMPAAAPGSAAWLLLRVPWLACLAVILAALVALFGPVERRTVLASRSTSQNSENSEDSERTEPARRPAAPGTLRSMAGRRTRTVLTVGGAAAVLAALLGIALAGSTYHGLTGLPVGAVAAYLTGAALLALLRRQGRIRWTTTLLRQGNRRPKARAPIRWRT